MVRHFQRTELLDRAPAQRRRIVAVAPELQQAKQLIDLVEVAEVERRLAGLEPRLLLAA
jgi:hypothetical protein